MSHRAASSIGALALVCAGHARMALATSSDEARTYAVPSECPARIEWLAALRARLPPLLRTHPLVEQQRVHVERLAAAGGSYEGHLDSASAPDSTPMKQRVRGVTCAEVIDVLSFMSALALERIVAEPAPASVAAPTSAAPRDAAAQAGMAPAADEALLSAGADRGVAATDAGPAKASIVGITAFALVQTGMAPGRSLDFGLSARLGWSLAGWQPLVLLGFYSGPASEVSVDGGAKVRFEHWSSQAVACPWRFPSRGALGWRPCLDLDVGMTRGAGLGVARAEEHAAPWVSGGTQLRFDWTPWDRLEVGVLLGALRPLYRARFFIRPSSTAFETADWGFRTGTYASLLF